MLAPGDCLMAPAHAELTPPHTERGGSAPTLPTPPTAPPCREDTKKDESEPRSFLLTLLRCLGAIHT
jgi:hypothetical protein